MCVSLGEVLVRPLAEALSVEERPRTRERLTAILLAFGAVGRRTVERLKSSPNPAVRRTAIYLLREFGGSEALPDLTELLDDNEPQVQREAVRAILNIGTDAAYQRARAGAGQRHRSDRATRSCRRSAWCATSARRRCSPTSSATSTTAARSATVYLRAIESLGALRDPEAIAPLKEALYRGEWWAPRRNLGAAPRRRRRRWRGSARPRRRRARRSSGRAARAASARRRART